MKGEQMAPRHAKGIFVKRKPFLSLPFVGCGNVTRERRTLRSGKESPLSLPEVRGVVVVYQVDSHYRGRARDVAQDARWSRKSHEMV